MEKTEKILVTGAAGMVGSAIVRELLARGYSNIVGTIHKVDPDFGSPAVGFVRLERLNLLDQRAVQDFFAKEQPKHVFLASAKVGGIHANNIYPAEFIHENLVIQTNIIHNAYLNKVDRLLFLGSSCIYPKLCPQPIKEEYLLTGPLEDSNKPYALAKIAGIEMCWAYNRQYGCRFIPVMPTNLYGENDNFNLEDSHVLPALIRKFNLAQMAAIGNLEAIKRDEQRFGKITDDVRIAIGLNASSSLLSKASDRIRVIVWGSGTPKREFLHVSDLANACVHILSLPEDRNRNIYSIHKEPLLNIGIGIDSTIAELAELVKQVVGFEGNVVFDNTKPNGTPQKLLDISRTAQLGWAPRIALREGISRVYQWYKQQINM